jgi:hypothetical protein
MKTFAGQVSCVDFINDQIKSQKSELQQYHEQSLTGEM